MYQHAENTHYVQQIGVSKIFFFFEILLLLVMTSECESNEIYITK